MTNLRNAMMAVSGTGEQHIIEGSGMLDGSSGYLHQITSDTGSPKKGTLHVEFKRSKLGTLQYLIGAGASGPVDYAYISFTTADAMRIVWQDSSDTTKIDWTSTQVFSDPSSWGIITVTWDTDKASPTFQVFYNNAEITLWTKTTNSLAQDDVGSFGTSGTDVDIGALPIAHSGFFDGYISRAIYLDGVVVTDQSDFGETSNDGYWQINNVSNLTFGTNGYLIEGGTDMAAGTDSSGSSNDFAKTGTITATNDSPTNDADNDYGNHCTLASNNAHASGTLTLGNLKWDNSGSASYRGAFGTLKIPASGKYRFKYTANTTTDGTHVIAVCLLGDNDEQGVWGSIAGGTPARVNMTAGSDTIFYQDGASHHATGSATTSGDTFEWLIDVDSNTIDFYINDSQVGTQLTSAFSGDPEDYVFYVTCYQTAVTFDFGQNGYTSNDISYLPFATQSFPTPTIVDPTAYFQMTQYTGDGGASLAVNQSGTSTFEPDFVWIKNFDAGENPPEAGALRQSHVWTDSVRGATKVISSDSTAAQTTDADTLLSFDSAGFTVGADDKVNKSGDNLVAWQWLESATPGFDIVNYTGNATGRTINHSLGAVPEFIIVKNLADTDTWAVYHAGNTSAPATDWLDLTIESGTVDDATIWNDTAPTSSVFSVGTSSQTNGNTEAMIAYLWAGVEGFSKFGSFVGNQVNPGPFVYCGFKPDFVIIKSPEGGYGGWNMTSWPVHPANFGASAGYWNSANTDSGEGATGYTPVEILSNGFKLRTANPAWNNSGEIMIFAAWAGKSIQGPNPASNTNQGRAS